MVTMDFIPERLSVYCPYSFHLCCSEELLGVGCSCCRFRCVCQHRAHTGRELEAAKNQLIKTFIFCYIFVMCLNFDTFSSDMFINFLVLNMTACILLCMYFIIQLMLLIYRLYAG
jgi:hypothetical protein